MTTTLEKQRRRAVPLYKEGGGRGDTRVPSTPAPPGHVPGVMFSARSRLPPPLPPPGRDTMSGHAQPTFARTRAEKSTSEGSVQVEGEGEVAAPPPSARDALISPSKTTRASPTWSPAAAAGLPATTSSTRAKGGSPTAAARAASAAEGDDVDAAAPLPPLPVAAAPRRATAAAADMASGPQACSAASASSSLSFATPKSVRAQASSWRRVRTA